MTAMVKSSRVVIVMAGCAEHRLRVLFVEAIVVVCGLVCYSDKRRWEVDSLSVCFVPAHALFLADDTAGLSLTQSIIIVAGAVRSRLDFPIVPRYPSLRRVSFAVACRKSAVATVLREV